MESTAGYRVQDDELKNIVCQCCDIEVEARMFSLGTQRTVAQWPVTEPTSDRILVFLSAVSELDLNR